ncbi:MAG: pyridoxamine 5'-phosphate oxidase family protein, partial [Achromobacter sp.]|nr:pyridoxamine 5'-phosphate oxidase family protein [Achromobacter sp.]
LGVPVWFHWDGAAMQMFTAAGTAKTRRIEREPWASLLVSNRVGEPEHWVAFDGPLELESGTGFELAEHLAGIYWDLADPARAAALEQWRAHRDVFCRMTLTPETIRTGS